MTEETVYSTNTETFRSTLNQEPTRAYEIFGLSLLYSLSPEEITREKYRLGVRPRSAKDYYNLGVLASQADRHEEALDLYTKAENLGGDFPEMYFNMGLTYERLKQSEKAIASYEKFADLAKGIETEEMDAEVRKVRAYIKQMEG